ncbi:MAG: 2-oxo acid dehydrogenase subunit E2 [Kiritimatiellae bacterium]|nr:2-oxo acid dehydrogenase subunit E2 [Kiritimatiellia bacterium]
MATEFKLPELGESIETIQVLKVLVSVGDTVAVDQSVLELETDKATIDLPSSVAGSVKQVHVAVGDELKIGDLIFSLEGATAEPDSTPTSAEPVAAPEPVAPVLAPEPARPEAPAASPSTAPTAVEFRIPELGESIETIQVLKVFASVGDTISLDDPALELETDKATIELPVTVAGVVEHVHVNAGDELSVGDLVFTVMSDAAPVAAPAAPAPEPATTEAPAPEASATEPTAVTSAEPVAESTLPASKGKRSPAAPSVRKFAREIGIDISQVPGTGPMGRISAGDVKTYSKQLNVSRSAPAVVAGSAPMGMPSLPELPDFGKFGTVKRDKMSVIRRKTAEQMTMSWLMVPHVTIFEKADITELDALRKRYGDRAEDAGGKLTVASMIIKIVAQALKIFPNFNASVDMVNREIIYKTYCNIGVAVDTERGLLVPVIKDVDRKTMIEIATELTEIAERTRSGKVQMADLEGGSFTVSNLGRTAGTFFTPIINYPEVAILGVGRMEIEASVEDGSPRKMLPLSLSFDHRAIDGADASRFLAWIIEALKEPFLLSLGG